MRTIKFRAWDKQNKKMINENVLSRLSFGLGGKLIDIMEHNGNLNEIYHPLTNIELMQFTGLYDKNGNEIYEGDVLSWCKYDEEFNDDYWQKYIVRIPEIFYSLEFHADIKTEIDVEIIGNIYENNDLIK